MTVSPSAAEIVAAELVKHSGRRYHGDGLKPHRTILALEIARLRAAVQAHHMTHYAAGSTGERPVVAPHDRALYAAAGVPHLNPEAHDLDPSWHRLAGHRAWAKLSRPVTTAAEVLREEFIRPLGLSESELCDELGVPYIRLMDFLADNVPLPAGWAAKLAARFDTSEAFWLNLGAGGDPVRVSDTPEQPSEVAP